MILKQHYFSGIVWYLYHAVVMTLKIHPSKLHNTVRNLFPRERFNMSKRDVSVASQCGFISKKTELLKRQFSVSHDAHQNFTRSPRLTFTVSYFAYADTFRAVSNINNNNRATLHACICASVFAHTQTHREM